MKQKLGSWLLLLALFLCPRGNAQALEWITLADNAVLPGEEALCAQYPSTLTRGARSIDLDTLLPALLGEDFLHLERNEYSSADEYRSANGSEPWEYRHVYVYDEEPMQFESLSYYNPWVCGERGGEYSAPAMNMLPDESMTLCRGLLEDILPQEWLSSVSPIRSLRDRWALSDRWMTDEEYARFLKEQKRHYFVFDHLSDCGLPILGEQVLATVGVDGLSGLSIQRHSFSESEEAISPMPLDEALVLANSTRSARCTLLYAGLTYSNWLTGDDTYHLSWYLVTDAGNYVVDCVLRQHLCDSYEY